jgi:Cu/Zn superoxide dismutase
VCRSNRFAGVVFGATLLASLVLGGSAIAQGAESANVQLTPSRDSGVSGTATLTDVEGGVRVQLSMKGLPEAGVKHINHIHGGGTCADDRAGRTAPVTIPLNAVVAREDGTGSATTTIEDVTLAELFGEDKERFILLHAKTEKGQGVPPGISCADLVPRSGNGTFDTLPASGGTRPSVLLLSTGATVAFGAVAGLLALWRRFA